MLQAIVLQRMKELGQVYQIVLVAEIDMGIGRFIKHQLILVLFD